MNLQSWDLMVGVSPLSPHLYPLLVEAPAEAQLPKVGNDS